MPVPLDISAALGLLENSAIPSVLACGGELKNTFCVTKGSKAFLSHHIGDLENIETFLSFESGIEHFKRIFVIEPQLAAFDLHPDYLSTKYAESLENLIKIPIQHHRAHIASCMAENGVTEPVIGVAFDGTGYGDDGCIWGGEFFTGTYSGLERKAHFEYVPLPGGDAAIREPWRMALSYLTQSFGEAFTADRLPFLQKIGTDRTEMVLSQLSKGVNAPLTSSVGRLFDAVSALLGLCGVIEYEGQAAIRLEKCADAASNDSYAYEIYRDCAPYRISVRPMLAEIVRDLGGGAGISRISGKFHHTIACIILDLCRLLRAETGINKVALSGGVFQNRLLLGLSLDLLEGDGFTVYSHSRVPTNDGGISLGQAVLAINEDSKIRGFGLK